MTRPIAADRKRRRRWVTASLLACVVAATVQAVASDGASGRSADVGRGEVADGVADGGGGLSGIRAGVVEGASEEVPALWFVEDEFPLRPRLAVWNKNRSHTTEQGDKIIGRVVVVDGDDEEQDAVVFGVEDAAGHPLRDFLCSGLGCRDMAVQVVEDTGDLYLYNSDWPGWQRYLNDTPTRVVEVSAEDSGSDLKIYRQVKISSPERRPDCSDYPDNNKDRFECLFLGEVLPEEAPETSQEMRDALPDLVQDSDNYSLVFAEEFNGSDVVEGTPCRDGLVAMNTDVWNFRGDPCERVDENGKACHNIEVGYYRMSWIRSDCHGGANTYGKMAFKYGYLEVKYNVDLYKSPAYRNYAIYTGGTEQLKFEFARYGITIDSMEDFLKYVETELDFTEFEPRWHKEYMHQNANVWEGYKVRSVVPTRTIKSISYCTKYGTPSEGRMLHPECPSEENNFTAGTATMTKGIEWTPRGYRTHLRVEGIHDDWVLFPKDRTRVDQKSPIISNGEVVDWGDFYTPADEDRERFFELLVPDDDSSTHIEKAVVSHLPVELRLQTKVFGIPTTQTAITNNMRIDYIRIYQPTDRYAGMEPVYQ